MPSTTAPAPPLTGRGALVTGSTSGIGLAIAQALAAAGATVLVNGLAEPAEGQGIADRIAADHGVETAFDPADVSDPDAAAAMLARAAERWGGIDILVNNAGIQFVSPVETFPAERWNRILAVNLSSVMWCSQAALPGMRARGWGRIVNVASAHGLVASPEKSAYVAAKHGVVGLTKTIALETAGSGVTCNAVCPGWVRTPLAERQVEAFAVSEALGLDEAARRLIGVRQPTGTFIDSGDIAELVLFLCGKAAAQITGAALQIDGGWTAQ